MAPASRTGWRAPAVSSFTARTVACEPSGRVSLREREIVIDRNYARCGCPYEWGVHVAYFAVKARLGKEQFASLGHGGPDDACWTAQRDRLVVTPRGMLQTRRLPASGAGPSAERLICGSEGTLGMITEAWMRVQPRPRYRAGASVSFADFADAVEAARELAQSGLHPANCRLLGHDEVLLSGSGDGSHSILVLGFESADHEVGPWLARALQICAGHRGEVREEEGDPAAAWRGSFLRGPHLRDGFTRLGPVHETFETAITWDRFWEFHQGVLAAVDQAVRSACGGGAVSCRFAYVYPDGPAPYYSVYAPGRPGRELEQWAEIKHAASEAILALGGTITHHHAVGHDHRRWYLREAPQLFTGALRGVKAELDPAGVMNPGVLLRSAGAAS